MRLNGLNSEKLGYIVGEVLELRKENNRRVGPAYKAVRAVFTSIAAALQRGEDVKINGFGIFRVRQRPPRKQYLSTYYGGNPTPLGHYIATLPSKKYVYFQPSKVLLRMINYNANAD